MAASLFRAPCMLRGDLVRAIPGIAADADTCLPPLQGNSRNASMSVTLAMPHGRLRYDIHARFGAGRRASARVGSCDTACLWRSWPWQGSPATAPGPVLRSVWRMLADHDACGRGAGGQRERGGAQFGQVAAAARPKISTPALLRRRTCRACRLASWARIAVRRLRCDTSSSAALSTGQAGSGRRRRAPPWFAHHWLACGGS